MYDSAGVCVVKMLVPLNEDSGVALASLLLPDAPHGFSAVNDVVMRHSVGGARPVIGTV